MFNKIKKKMRIDFSKNIKLFFYIKGFFNLLIPFSIYKKNFLSIYESLNEIDKDYINKRVNYYNKQKSSFKVSVNACQIIEFIKNEKKKTYYFDLLEYVKYFSKKYYIEYIFGDVTYVPNIPSIVKSRPIKVDNTNSILMKLNKIRHFIFVNDDVSYEDKLNKAVWRGKCYTSHRNIFVELFYNKEFCDIGQTNTKGNMNVPWQKNKLSLNEQLRYKFLIAIEGNDVASNLKWAMSSNSLVLMSKPQYETWFMEGTLIPNYHYVLLKDDYSDMEEKIIFYTKHTDKAKEIISHANKYIEQFKNEEYEDLISYMVLQKYFKYSDQS